MENQVIFTGDYTLENLKSENHKTFKLHRQPMDSNFAPGSYIVSLFVGNDNENPYNYKGIAFLNVNTEMIYLWKKHQSNEILHELMEILADYIFAGITKEGYFISLEKKCIICSRKLTNPESLKSGIGPVCASKAS